MRDLFTAYTGFPQGDRRPGGMMAYAFDPNLIFAYLTRLKKNNTKAWFDKHRPEYDRARGLFEEFVDHLIDALLVSDGGRGVSARDCMFRINRDVRFSRDKSPYKTHFSAVIGPEGRKSTGRGYYLALEPGNRSMIAGGLHMPAPEQLSRFRAEVARDAMPLRRIVASREFKATFGAIQGDRLATAPKGYDRGHPDIDLLRLKEATVVHHVDDADAVKPGFPRRAVRVCNAMDPFLDFLFGSHEGR